MIFNRNNIAIIVIVLLSSGCASQHIAKKKPNRPGKQCKILVQDKWLTKKKYNPNIKWQKAGQPEHENLQAQLMTNEEYQKLVEKVQKSLPQFDVEKDCPQPSKRNKKKFSLKDIFNK